MEKTRPGSFALTELLIEHSDLKPGDRVLDVGCGQGATVRFLRRQYRLAAEGIDLHPPQDGSIPLLRQGDAMLLERYYKPGYFHGVICECCLSLFADPDRVLAAMHAILQPGGWLLLSDVYLLSGPSPSSEAAWSTGREHLEQLLHRHKLIPTHYQDHRQVFRQWVGQCILEQGREQFWQSVGLKVEHSSRGRYSYYTAAARSSLLGELI